MAHPSDLIELRCPWQKHGEVEPGATGILRCKCRECVRKNPEGGVVIHHFDLATGDYITKKYRDAFQYVQQRRRERDRPPE